MHDLLAGVPSERLDLDAYQEDFATYFWNCGEAGFWKLERQQHFREPGVASWEAFSRGEWPTALTLIAEQEDHFERYFREIKDHGFALHRVRVVEEPLAPYLQWELHLLRLKEKHGEDTRVVGPDDVRAFESDEVLPEIAILGTSVMYEIVYDERGVLAGGRRFTDAAKIAACKKVIQDLHRSGERLHSFFERRVSPLPPPEA
ncbi:DUF6879 family protein [Streptomyces sp. NPDC006638]|uniref:DUF6879 family protein n=1 Tax=Streptomyces sp. NPDC006638 TaxID=3157183 RepID=UPI0033AEC812